MCDTQLIIPDFCLEEPYFPISVDCDGNGTVFEYTDAKGDDYTIVNVVNHSYPDHLITEVHSMGDAPSVHPTGSSEICNDILCPNDIQCPYNNPCITCILEMQAKIYSIISRNGAD